MSVEGKKTDDDRRVGKSGNPPALGAGARRFESDRADFGVRWLDTALDFGGYRREELQLASRINPKRRRAAALQNQDVGKPGESTGFGNRLSWVRIPPS